MIVHLFNSSSVSGPERLVLPALATEAEQFTIVNLKEDRVLHGSDPLEEFCRSLRLRYAAVRVKGRWDRGAIRRLHEILNELNPALVHAHAFKASAYLRSAGRGESIHRFPIVSTHHGVRGLPDWKTRVYDWYFRRYILRSYDRVLSVSTIDYELLLSSGLSKSHLRLHLNGIDGRWIDQTQRPEEARKIRAQWLPQEVDADRLFLFGVVGRLSSEKDHARLLRVLDGLNRLPGQREWKCLVFGMGSLEERLRQQARRLGLEKRVLWMGYRPSVGNELAGLDLLLSFSKAEGLPINLIEAGWAGTPVMATWVGGVRDLIPDDPFGIRVPPEEPVEESARRLQTLLSKEAQAELSARASRFQERVTKEFTQEKWMQRLMEIYSELGPKFMRVAKYESSNH